MKTEISLEILLVNSKNFAERLERNCEDKSSVGAFYKILNMAYELGRKDVLAPPPKTL